MRSPLVLLVGSSPPPYNGMSVATELVRNALRGVVPCIHLDTADRRGLANLGKFDLTNVFLALLHGAKCIWILLSKWPAVVYVPISQARLPFLRDCLFLIPARLTRRKVVIHLHGAYFGRFYKQSSLLMQAIIRYCLSQASLAIVLGENVTDVFDGILPRERIRIVPNGIHDSFVYRADRRNGTVRLLYLGSLDAQKGVLDILNALSTIKVKGYDFECIFAGSWYAKSDEVAARQIIRDSGLGTCVRFVGAVGPSQKHGLLENADFLVFPTKYKFECHPYVVLEGMAAGLPILSTRVACIPETVRDGVEGFLIDPGDIRSLIEKIERLIGDKSLRRRLGQAARARFLEKYTYEQFSLKMTKVFREAVGEVLEHSEASATCARFDSYSRTNSSKAGDANSIIKY